MKAIEIAQQRQPAMDQGKIIRYGCPDSWGIKAKPLCIVNHESTCKECWEQQGSGILGNM